MKDNKTLTGIATAAILATAIGTGGYIFNRAIETGKENDALIASNDTLGSKVCKAQAQDFANNTFTINKAATEKAEYVRCLRWAMVQKP